MKMVKQLNRKSNPHKRRVPLKVKFTKDFNRVHSVIKEPAKYSESDVQACKDWLNHFGVKYYIRKYSLKD